MPFEFGTGMRAAGSRSVSGTEPTLAGLTSSIAGNEYDACCATQIAALEAKIGVLVAEKDAMVKILGPKSTVLESAVLESAYARNKNVLGATANADGLDIFQRLRVQTGNVDKWPVLPKECQIEVLTATSTKRRDCVAIIKTGGGKTLTYVLPAVAAKKTTGAVTIVITMLRVLIKQQVVLLNTKHGENFAAHALVDRAEGESFESTSTVDGEDVDAAIRIVDLTANLEPGCLEARMLDPNDPITVIFKTPESLVR
jgi:hypothetical protein